MKKSFPNGWIVAFISYFLILLGIMALAAKGKLVNFSLAHPPYDKLGHFILYGIASFLGHRASGRRMMVILGYPLPVGPLIFTLFTIAEEMLQAMFPNRSAGFDDLLASFSGIVLFFWLGELWDNRKQASGVKR